MRISSHSYALLTYYKFFSQKCRRGSDLTLRWIAIFARFDWLERNSEYTLGYSLFCDRSQDGVSFRDIYLSDKWSSGIQTNTRKRRTLACRCLLVGKKLFYCWICNKIIKNDPTNTVNSNVNKLLTKWRLLFTKSYFFYFYPTDLVNTKTSIPLRVGS